METLFDFSAIRDWLAGGHTMTFDALHAVTGPYGREIFVHRLGADIDHLFNIEPLTDFGGGHPDPNPVHAADLYARMMADGAPDFGAASDGDGDRNMIMGRGIYVGPSDSLAVLAANAHHVPAYAGGIAGIARSMPTSRAADAVARELGVAMFETPTGWKYFGNLMDAGHITLCGEESAGTSSTHVREKDGLWAVLMWLNILAVRRESVADIMTDHWRHFGRHYYSRHDYDIAEADKADRVMAALRSQLAALPGQTFAGETVQAADSFAFHDPVDGSVAKDQGFRVMFESGARFVLRKSGTGTRGATLRLYLEAYEPSDGRHDMEVQVRLKPMIEAANKILRIGEITGQSVPDLIS